MSVGLFVFVADSGALLGSVWRSETDPRPSTASGGSGEGGRHVHARVEPASHTLNVTATIHRELLSCVLYALHLLVSVRNHRPLTLSSVLSWVCITFVPSRVKSVHLFLSCTY